ncbi:hypothetical protein [Aeromonas aquatica]|uniref:hypothetical protein n=1 Tax=Aeromonas aquatica TaxID=558964 RepID=UPI00051AB77D|nr:hypothetical protein [Aeromonas aquatica]
MARTDPALELRKARQNTGAMELNPSAIQRYAAVLRGTSLPPVLACSPGLVLPAALHPVLANPQAEVVAGLIHQGSLASTPAAPVADLVATIIIECAWSSTAQPVSHHLQAGYDINVFRGASHTSQDDWQRAALLTEAVASDWQTPAVMAVARGNDWQEGAVLTDGVTEHSGIMPKRYQVHQGRFDEGQPLGAQAGHSFDSLPPGHTVVGTLWVEAAKVDSWHLSGYRYPPRLDRAWQADTWQQGAPLGQVLGGDWQLGDPLHKGWRDGWDEAIQPPPGTSPYPEKPVEPAKPERRKLQLAFNRLRGDASLEFVWYGQDAQIVIPTRRVYLVSNTASIVRVRDGLDIPATSLSIELDTDSWAWQFSAQIPRIAAAALTDEEEVSIHINGQQWDCVCDGWQSSQSFARESATLSGRSRTAYLSPTHLLPHAVSESAAATMAQLAAALLPFGWTLDWQAPDWLVPAGFFSLDSQTPIEAIKYLAEAAGGFVLPHQRSQHLVIMPRYPTVPWQLDTALADVAIPRAIITTLGSDFQPGQAANGIWVSGGHQGISARVLRQGTAGERQAPTITHPLVCDVLAARAQGVVALAKTLPRRTQTIELPLSADTGLILPGALLAVDGWKGYNRGVRVSAALQNKAMTVRQQLSVERFV